LQIAQVKHVCVQILVRHSAFNRPRRIATAGLANRLVQEGQPRTHPPRVLTIRWAYVRPYDNEQESTVPIFMVERTFAEELEPSLDAADGINRINAEEGVRWLYSFLSADKRKTYCLYEAPSPEAIRTAAARAGLPADVVVEVNHRIMPDGALSDI
jgi:hypothetical protein